MTTATPCTELRDMIVYRTEDLIRATEKELDAAYWDDKPTDQLKERLQNLYNHLSHGQEYTTNW